MAICEGEPMNQDQLWYTIGTLADHPTNQSQLGYIIGALADHPNELELAGVHDMSSG